MKYRATGVGMKRGYYRIVNTENGTTVRSGFVSKAAAQQIADNMNEAEARRSHPHLCPVCRKAFNCIGQRCVAYNGVPHPACAPTNRFAKWTQEVPS